MPVEVALEKERRKDVEDGGIGGADMTLGEEGEGTYEVGFLQGEAEVAIAREVAGGDTGEVTLCTMGAMIAGGVKSRHGDVAERGVPRV
jgi:hypothetical protein